MDILENPGLRGRAFVDALASLGDTLEDGPSWGQLGANMSQLEPTWGHIGANLGPTWANLDQLGPTCANLGPTWGPTWLNMGQHGAKLGPRWGSLGANLGQLGSTWAQLVLKTGQGGSRQPQDKSREANRSNFLRLLPVVHPLKHRKNLCFSCFFRGFSSIGVFCRHRSGKR